MIGAWVFGTILLLVKTKMRTIHFDLTHENQTMRVEIWKFGLGGGRRSLDTEWSREPDPIMMVETTAEIRSRDPLNALNVIKQQFGAQYHREIQAAKSGQSIFEITRAGWIVIAIWLALTVPLPILASLYIFAYIRLRRSDAEQGLTVR